MRILRVIATMKPESGGPCQGIRNIVPALTSLGVINEVVCFDEPETNYNSDPFIIHALGIAKGPYAYQPELENWLFENIERFDVIIIHGLWLYNSYGTYRVWKKNQNIQSNWPKLYLMPHGMLDPYFQKAKGRLFKALRNRLFWRLIERKVVNGVDGILFTCEQELLLARQNFASYHPKKELNLGYGVPEVPRYNETMRSYLAQQSLCEMPERYLLFLSRIHKKKGIDLLIRAYLQMTNEDMPDLVIAGPGLNTSYGKELQKLVMESDKVHFTGMLNGDAKWGAFYGAEAFILPSHQENFGIAVVEALACGIPVLISDQVNIWREIQEGGGGLVSADTQDAIVCQLQIWSMLSVEEKKIYARQAEMTYKRYFSIEVAAKKFKEIFTKELK